MVFQKREFAKTFDIDKDEFVYLKGKHDLEELEKLRYLDSQINLLEAKILKLLMSIQDGSFKISPEELQKKLDGYQNTFDKLFSKVSLYSVIINDSQGNIKSILELADKTASLKDTESVVKKVSELESRYSLLSKPRMQNIFVNMIETAEVLSARARNLELAIGSIVDLRWSQKLKDVKKTISANEISSIEQKRKEQPVVAAKNEAAWEDINESINKLKILSLKRPSK
jgi:hypothetical protein